MHVIITILLILPLIYTVSYARYNWTMKNKWGAIGAFILALTAFLLPFSLIWLRR